MAGRRTQAKRRAGRKPRAVTERDVRREVESWSRAQLVDFALERIDRDPELRARLERALTAGRDEAAAARELQREVDRVLDVGFVEWREVRAFVGRLDDLLREIVSFGDGAPRAALGVIWHFVEAVPGIFDSVHDECEMANFCRDLAQAAVALTKKARAPVRDMAARLLDACVADGSGRFDDVLRALAGGRFAKDEREWIAAAAEERAASAATYQASELRALARRLRRKAASKAKRKGRAKSG